MSESGTASSTWSPSSNRADLPLTDRVDFESTAALVLAWRGDPAAAARFAALDELVAGVEPDLAVASLRGRQADAALAMGRPDGALRYAEAAIPMFRTTGLRTSILDGTAPAARAALWAGDLDRAKLMIDEIERSGLHGHWVSGLLLTLGAGVAALSANPTAVDRYAEAAASWRRLDVPLQLALCQLEAAHLLPADLAETSAARDEARAIMDGLPGAGPDRPARTGLVAAEAVTTVAGG